MPFFKGEIIIKKAKIHWQNVKSLCSRTTGPISTKLDTKRPRLNQASVCEGDTIVYKHKIFSLSVYQVSEVVHGPLVFFLRNQVFFHGLNEGSYAPLHGMVIANFLKITFCSWAIVLIHNQSQHKTPLVAGTPKLIKKIAIPLSSPKKNNSNPLEKLHWWLFEKNSSTESFGQHPPKSAL